MKRLWRILVDVASVASAIVCAMTAFVTLRSLSLSDELASDSYAVRAGSLQHTCVAAYSARGRLVFCVRQFTNSDPAAVANAPIYGKPDRYWRTNTLDEPYGGRVPYAVERNLLGFAYLNRQASSGYDGDYCKAVVLPDWFPLLLSALLPFWAQRRWRAAWRNWLAERNRRMGLCPTCGYNLIATPLQCPECGTVPNAKKL